MKNLVLFLVGLTFLGECKTHVTTRLDVSTKLSENKTISENNNEIKNNVNGDASRVYLEDVLYSLKHQNWTDDELPCLNQTLRLLRSLQNFTLWAVWDWDSVASQPQGLLQGNRYQLGNFDECLNLPWFKTNPELQTQYCLAEIVLERTDHAVRKKVSEPVNPYGSTLDFIQYRPPYSRPLNKLTWGACVPAFCPPQAVEKLMSTMLARSHLGAAGMRPRISITEPCQKAGERREFDGLFYAFIIVMGSLAAAALICTYINSRKDKSEPYSVKDEVVRAFCIHKNVNELLTMKREGVEVLYGIRFLTICFIVMDHQLGIFNGGPISNGLEFDKEVISVIGMFIVHNDLFVDTFFLLSGFLAANVFRKFKRFPNPAIFILKRYVRIVIAFAVVIFFVTAAYPYIGSGPLWNRAIANDTDQCRKNWWLSLLMLSNYVDNENICIVTSWYIPCDFHFFVVAVLVYWLYQKHKRLALTIAAMLTVASVVVSGIINYVDDLPAVQLFTFEFISDPRASKQFHATYIKSHTRFAAYIVGFLAGCIFSNYKSTGSLDRISKKWAILGTLTGLTVMTSVMCVGATYLWRSYHPLEGAVYASINRPIWAIGVSILVLSLSLGYVPFVKRFLEWYPFAPLSRLSYGLYLTHVIIIIRNTFVTRDPRHNDYLMLLTSACGVIVVGCVIALLIWLLAEAPANNLLNILLKPSKKFLKSHLDSAPVTVQQAPSVATIETESTGHLEANLPSNIQLSSKI